MKSSWIWGERVNVALLESLVKIVLEIVAGQLKVTGDAVLQDKIASLGLLELAKVAIIQQPTPQPGVEVPNGALQRHLLNGK
jgi:hypothetical protein